jgi:hypothetical protein
LILKMGTTGLEPGQLADYYQQTYLLEPEYVDGRKVAGYRSRYELQLRLNVLRNYFANERIKPITHGDLERFKAVRLRAGCKINFSESDVR